MAPRAPAVLVLAALVLAGCLQAPQPVETASVPPVAVPELGLGKILELLPPLPDGLKAHGTVYLPDVPEGTKVPAIMDLGPYYGDLNPETNIYNKDHPPNLLYNDLLKRGYAIVLMSVRGTGQSEGCFAVGGQQEQEDAAAVVEWLATQEWSDGNIGMTGVSYDGTTPWEAAVKAPPHLKAIVPVEGISDMYRYTFFDGVPVSNGPAFQTWYTALVDWAYLNGEGVPQWAAAQPTNLCPEQAQWFADSWLTWQDGAHDAYWQERDTAARMPDITAPTFVVHGFQDWNVRMDEVQWSWQDLKVAKRMLLGQWEHNIPWRNSFNEDWSFPAYNATIAQWFDAFLKGDEAAKAAALAAPPVLAQDSQGTWWNLTAWPPTESKATPLHVTANATLSSAAEGTKDFVFRSYPTRDEPSGLAGLAADTARGATAPLRPPSTVLFASPTLDAPVHLMGNAYFHATVSVDKPGGALTATLYDEGPLHTRTKVVPGHLNLAQRESRDEAQDVPTGQPLDITVRMYALNHVFEAGHRLILELDGEGTEWPSPNHPDTTWTVHVAPETPAWLEAPVFAGQLPLDDEAPTTAPPRP